MKQIAYLTLSGTLTAEEKAGLAFARSRGARRVGFSRLSGGETLAQRFGVIWWHSDRRTQLPREALAPESLHAVREFVERGGTLLLSLLSAPYVHALGVERTPPTILCRGPWRERSWTRGYPDIRGLAGYRAHPLFKRLHGAAYTWNPAPGAQFSAAIYDQGTRPEDGEIIAVERQYIRVDEHRIVAVSYSVGKGVILTLGTHFFFAFSPNRFRPHLEVLASDALQYRGMSPDARRTNPWHRTAGKPLKENLPPSAPLRTRATVARGGSETVIVRETATNNEFDLGGERLLIQGHERKGIREVWVHPARILRDLRIRITPQGGQVVSLSTLAPRVTVRPGSVTREFTVARGSVTERVFSHHTHPCGAVLTTLKGPACGTITFTGRVDLRMMWPLPPSSTGRLMYGWDMGLAAARVRNSENTAACLLGADRPPSTIRMTARGRSVEVELSYVLRRGGSLLFCFAGSGNDPAEAVRAYRVMLRHPAAALDGQEAHGRRLLRSRTMLTSPDPLFNAAYRWAVTGTDRFLVRTPGVGTSLMAGFGSTDRGWDGGQRVSGRPGYAWYFGRDSVWTALAMLDAGDSEAARNVLAFLGTHQDVTGKIAHEVTTSGYVHYDAADATPLYVILMGRYLRATGDRSFVRREYPRLQKALAFCASTDTDGDHLIENTGVGHGWVEGGALFPAHAELYLNACWLGALREAAYCAAALSRAADRQRWQRNADRVEPAVQNFWDEKSRFFSFARRSNGSYVTEPTVMAAVLFLFSHTPREKATAVLTELGSRRFTAPWGTRIVGTDSSIYNPAGYHDGSVWPLFTGWTSMAAFRSGSPALGFRLLLSTCRLITRFSAGNVPEVLHGEEQRPAGVCDHQAWSSSMILQPALEGLLGLRWDAMGGRIFLRPYLPEEWADLKVRGIRLGGRRFAMDLRRKEEGVECRLRLVRGNRASAVVEVEGIHDPVEVSLRPGRETRLLLPLPPPGVVA